MLSWTEKNTDIYFECSKRKNGNKNKSVNLKKDSLDAAIFVKMRIKNEE